MIYLLAFLWLLFTGIGLAHLALPGARLSEKAALAFPLSAGLHATVHFLLMQSTGASPYWTLLVLSPLLWPLPRAWKAARAGERIPVFSWQGAAAGFLIAAAAARVCAHLLLVPALEWDSVAMWLLKGRALFVDGALTADFVYWLQIQGLHPDYPWNIPMMQVWLAGIAGAYRESAILWIYVFFFLSQLAIFFSIARLWWSPVPAAWWTAFYTGIPALLLVSSYRDADVILETLIAAALFLVLRRREIPHEWSALGLGVAVFLCGWTKVEGIVFACCLLLPWTLLLLLRSRGSADLKIFLTVVTAALLSAILYSTLKWRFDADTLFSQGLAPMAGVRDWISRAGMIAAGMGREMLDLRRWNLVWPVAIVWLFRGDDPHRLKLLFLGQLGVYFAVYVLAPVDPAWHMRTSLTRILMHTLPVLFAGCACAVARAGRLNTSAGRAAMQPIQARQQSAYLSSEPGAIS